VVTTPVLLAIVILLAVGAGLQRIAGFGLGLVVAPMLTLLLGPAIGVTVSNAGAIATTVLVLGALRSDVDWRAFLRLAPLIVVGSAVGAVVVLRASPAWLEVLVGALILIALALTLGVAKHIHVRGRLAAMTIGVVGGFVNTTAGVAGSPLTAYAVATRWAQRSFAATLQPILLLANASALVGKSVVGAIPDDVGLSWWMWLLSLGAVVVGVLAGGYLARWVSASTGRRVSITIAALGGLLTLVRGLSAL
jgi:uncharacterized membrane protein YfcA